MSEVRDAIVIGAGQAGLAASYELMRRGIDHVVLDGNPGPGGAWQHRWDSLTMMDVHGVADLPGQAAPQRSGLRANTVIPEYFGEYERTFGLPVVHGVRVDRVESEGSLLVIHGLVASAQEVARDKAAELATAPRTWRSRTLVNATGTWTRPFVPHYPGAETFTGEQFHTASYPGVERLRGRRVLVVGGGASAVQFLGEIAPLTDVVWVTRRPPLWNDEFDGLAVVRHVEERTVKGLPPESVVTGTGLKLREQERAAAALGVYERRLPMFDRIEPEGVRWADGRFEPVDVILWATGFRPAVDHLAPLKLRSPHGGIELVRVPGIVQGATTAAKDPRVNFVGYGPSASTVGATRAARQAAKAVERCLARKSADSAATL